MADLIACINSDFQTEAKKQEAEAELNHRTYSEQQGIEDVMSQ